MKIERANEIINKYYDEFSLLNRYKNVPLAELDEFVGLDWICIKAYCEDPRQINIAKRYLFRDFLKEFKFYVQGNGTIFPANFGDIDYRATYGEKKLLSEEMVRVYREIVEKTNGKESSANQH